MLFFGNMQADPEPALRAGRPRKYSDPAPGEEASAKMRHALRNRANMAAAYAADPEPMRARARAHHRAHMARYREAVRLVEEIKMAANAATALAAQHTILLAPDAILGVGVDASEPEPELAEHEGDDNRLRRTHAR